MTSLNTYEIARPVYLVDGFTGVPLSLATLTGGGSSANTGLDTQGNPVPTYKAHTYAMDGSGNIATDTVTDGTNTWVRTYMYQNGAISSDSGWVKQ